MIYLMRTGQLPHLTPTLSAPKGQRGGSRGIGLGSPSANWGVGTGEVGGRGSARAVPRKRNAR